MTSENIKNKIDYFIGEAKYLRGTVFNLLEGPGFCMDTEITDARFEIFQKDILLFIKEITNDEEYIKQYTNIGPYENCVGEVQQLLIKLKKTL